ncbi:MAG: adenylyltransferase/cytidyltransferase family protein [Nanoarchaeota archaeon]
MIPNSALYYQGEEASWTEFLERLSAKHLSQKDLIGMLGGRFMPFHQGHFQTLEALTRHYSHVHVGIVNPDPWNTLLKGDRFTLDKNFLTYAERVEMVTAALEALSCHATIAPYYPIREYNERVFWNFTPGNPEVTVEHLAVRDDFDRWKKERWVEERKTFVEVPLICRESQPYGATEIRRMMLEGSEEWRQWLPSFTADVIDQYHIVERLRDLSTKREL